MADSEIRIVAHDIIIGGEKAFYHGEHVSIEALSPNPERPEYKYVVYSNSLKRRFQLRDEDLIMPQPQFQAPIYRPVISQGSGREVQATGVQAQPGMQHLAYRQQPSTLSTLT